MVQEKLIKVVKYIFLDCEFRCKVLKGLIKQTSLTPGENVTLSKHVVESKIIYSAANTWLDPIEKKICTAKGRGKKENTDGTC